ncbi:hypothetical protein QJS66_07525 [Kocuria rhizophila]|nr:hypothetical protein QJS66_07525 [Kocuria rhizophila]
MSFNILQILVGPPGGRDRRPQGGPGGRALPEPHEIRAGHHAEVVWWITAWPPWGYLGLIGTAVFEYCWTSTGSPRASRRPCTPGRRWSVYPVIVKLNGLSVKQSSPVCGPPCSWASCPCPPWHDARDPARERVQPGVPGHYASFAIPVGVTTKMDGCAVVYPAVALPFRWGRVLRRGTHAHALRADRPGLRAGLGRHRGNHRGHGHAHPDPVHLGLPLDGVGLLLAVDPSWTWAAPRST